MKSVDAMSKPFSENMSDQGKNSSKRPNGNHEHRTLQEHVVSSVKGQHFLPPRVVKEKRKKNPKFELPQTTLSSEAK